MNPRITIRDVGLGLLYTAILYASFVHDAFRIAGPLHTCVIGFDSHHVLDRIDAGADGCPSLSPLSPHYLSQFGLQGVVLSGLARWSNADLFAFSYAAASLLALAMCAGMAAYFVAAGRWLGRLAGHIGVALMASSLIWMSFAPSLYWASFLLLAPFQLVWLLEPLCSSSRLRFAGLIASIGVAVMLKCLCGYEYVTAVILSPLAALAFHRVRSASLSWRTFWPASAITAAGLAGFAVAMTIHAIQIGELTGRNGWEVIAERARARTVSGGDPRGENRIALESSGLLERFDPQTAFAVTAFFRYFSMPPTAVPVGLASRKFIPLYWYVAMAGVMLIALLRRDLLSANGRALAIALGTGLLASLSWQVLAVNHMAVHFHLNLVVFFIPFLPLAFVTIGWLIQRFADAFVIEQWVTSAVACSVAALALFNSIATQCTAAAAMASDEQVLWAVSRTVESGMAIGTAEVTCRMIRSPIGDWGFELEQSTMARRMLSGEFIEVAHAGRQSSRIVVTSRGGAATVFRFSKPLDGRATVRLPAAAALDGESTRVFLVRGSDGLEVSEIRLPRDRLVRTGSTSE